MNRRDRVFAARGGGASSDLIPTHVSFLAGRDGRGRRQRGELRPLQPAEKALCALRKVLAHMSTQAGGRTRYFIIGEQVRIRDPHVSPGAKEGDPGTYRFSGRCRLGLAHATGEAGAKMIEFTVSFRDTEDARGLPDVDYFDPTTIDEIDATTPL